MRGLFEIAKLSCAAMLLACWVASAHAGTDYWTEGEIEPPRLRLLIGNAMKIESSAKSTRIMLCLAAKMYCEASRLGSIEAQYRLGLLYAAGRGVPKDPEFAAVLFSLAAQQGHARAFDMLRGFPPHTSELPACMMEQPDSPMPGC